MNLSKVSVVCNQHIYVCLGNTTLRFKEVKNPDAYIITGVFIQGNSVFIQAESR